MSADKTLYCQWCGKDITGAERTFYGNVVCGEECREGLAEAVYFRDGPPDEGATWHCPHCAATNPIADPKKDARPNCASCDKPLDPASAAPPKKGGCGGALLMVLLPAVGAWLV